MKVPQVAGNRLGMDEYTTANRTERSLVKVKRSLGNLPSQDLRIERRLPKEIESELSLQRSRSQRYGGNDGSTPAKMERKWALNVLIACSAWF